MYVFLKGFILFQNPNKHDPIMIYFKMNCFFWFKMFLVNKVSLK